MNYSVTVAEAAENDIRQAFLWYEDQKENDRTEITSTETFNNVSTQLIQPK